MHSIFTLINGSRIRQGKKAITAWKTFGIDINDISTL
jgi:hypothetical protein